MTSERKKWFQPIGWIKQGIHYLSGVRSKFFGIKTIALVGESGTGKSFHAQSIASLLNCSYIIDDGLLIHGQQILAGKTSKNEVSPLKAIRRAIFTDDKHMQAVRDTIRIRHADRIMIIGTSEKMVRLICERLGLPQPSRTVYIHEFAQPEDLMAARRSRDMEGKHVIPAPQVEVKKVFSHAIVASVSQLLASYRLHRHPPQTIEKSVVRPGYQMGRLTISESALASLVKVIIERHDPEVEVHQVRVQLSDGHMHVYGEVAVALGDNLPQSLGQAQQEVYSQVRQFTGMHVERVDLNVVDIHPPMELEARTSGWKARLKKKKKDKKKEPEEEEG